MDNLLLGNQVSETMLIPLECKVLESQQAQKLFVDKEAIELTKRSNRKVKHRKVDIVGTAIRVKYFDDVARCGSKFYCQE